MAERKVGSHLVGGNGSELKKWAFERLPTDPTTPFNGQLWENTTEKRISWYDGTAVHQMAHLGDISSALNWKGGYDANTNTPNLDSTPPVGSITLGDFFYVTVAGDFYGEAVQVGDALIANQDDPTALSHWTRVQFNVDQATETVLGLVKIATQAITNAGTNDTDAITPLKLVTYLGVQNYTRKFSVDLDGAEATVTRTFAGGETVWEVTHSLGTLDLSVDVYEVATGEQVLTQITNTGANITEIAFNGNLTDGTYRTVMIG